MNPLPCLPSLRAARAATRHRPVAAAGGRRPARAVALRAPGAGGGFHPVARRMRTAERLLAPASVRRRPHRALWLWVFSALLLAQTLGFVHQLAHPHNGLGVAVWKQPAGQPADAGRAWLERLFSGHDRDSACRLYDQAGHADALHSVPALVVPAVLFALVPILSAGQIIARTAAPLEARGPPSVR
ncbi:hypothetical protein [Variovorax terrae]|uniref:Uncharacterized protein n=1 Tax=Variovorax terrae TaxID=2923278 RepID=A0A9X1VS31_9BURK|nr:hypothetical protein [Variovorax terrae]MCJ0762298.1 hypothetical protein [Variovorax terrae]